MEIINLDTLREATENLNQSGWCIGRVPKPTSFDNRSIHKRRTKIILEIIVPCTAGAFRTQGFRMRPPPIIPPPPTRPSVSLLSWAVWCLFVILHVGIPCDSLFGGRGAASHDVMVEI